MSLQIMYFLQKIDQCRAINANSHYELDDPPIFHSDVGAVLSLLLEYQHTRSPHPPRGGRGYVLMPYIF